MKKFIRHVPREVGQSMVELALTITILMVLLAGTIDFGRAFFTWIEMRDAAQEGAAFGSFCPDATKIETRVRANLNPIYSYDVDPDLPTSPSIGDPITINISTDLPIAMPFLSTLIPSGVIPIHATITDSIVGTDCP
jgi:hypothetical protein